MMLDKENLFSDQQDFATLVAATYLSDKSIDLGQVGWYDLVSKAFQGVPQGGALPTDPGKGKHPELFIRVTTAFTVGTAVQVNLIQADDAALTSNVQVLASTPVVVDADLVAGYRFKLNSIPAGVNKRYLGLQYVTTGTHTTGKITAGIVSDADSIPV